MRRKTPQQKKQKGYAKDRRNVYGEANKSARQMLRKRKRKPNRAERRAVHQAVRTPADVADPVQLEALDIEATKKRGGRTRWQKVPDVPLGEIVESRLRRRMRMGINDAVSAEARIEKVRRRSRA